MDSTTDIYDLMILVDATASMGDYLISLQTSLPKIISISALTDSFSRIGLLAYRDYGDDDLTEWSGWTSPSKPNNTDIDILAAARNLAAHGGGDYPEAAKTGLATAYSVMRADATTLILLYTDAPPHTVVNGQADGFKYAEMERKTLMCSDHVMSPYGMTGYLFGDWVQGARTLAGKQGNKRAHVFSILEPAMVRSDGNYYTFLSTLTGGSCFYLKSSAPEDISKVTVDILLAWMGVAKEGAAVVEIAARLARFKNPAGIEDVKKEATKEPRKPAKTVELDIDSKVLKEFMPKRKTPVGDLSQRYKSDPLYKQLVLEHLTKIVEQDVSAISLNPVFGSLWRTVCNDRENADREQLISSFSLQVNRISNADEKARMKSWLEESYDYSAEIQEMIETLPEGERFPCVYLDPTLVFTKLRKAGEVEDEDDRPVTEFRRDELLEIGRSCDYRVLRRLGHVLTRLSFANTPAELPGHIANAKAATVARIPLALASKELGRRFWRILFHIVVPGTMLSARPAALLAALTIRLGIQPLSDAAATEMLIWRDKWNDLGVPETWNVSRLSLLLDADKAYSRMKQIQDDQGLLKEEDRKLFELLVSYKMLELNLKTTLMAQVSWKPEKTMVPLGPVVECRACHYPRSVTIMGAKGRCGPCSATDYKTPQERRTRIGSRVTNDDTSETLAAWVECCVTTCRAQYVVYYTEGLNVRAKCHYCRQQSIAARSKRKSAPAPWLECEQCLSRLIYPEEYRQNNAVPFKCVACSHGHRTIAEVETTAEAITKENSISWLLENKNKNRTRKKLIDPFGGASLFKHVTQAGTAKFCEKVILFPNADEHELFLKGKFIQNVPDVINQLKSWVSARRTESTTCSLCFSTLRKNDINPACGRRGCDQRVCRNCLHSWYGLNHAGRIINVAALSCPFCRRAPTARTLHNYGMGIHAVGDLRDAVENAGEWVYAWCSDCSRAKQYLERVCAAGAPAELRDRICGGCEQAREELAVREAELAIEERRREGFRERAAAEQATELARLLKHIKLKSLNLKKCPHCGILVEKAMGCGHLTCICGGHWCWFCGEKSTAQEIYRHMDERHGSWFGTDECERFRNDDTLEGAPCGLHCGYCHPRAWDIF